MKEKLTEHFTYEEMTKTDQDLPNDPNDFQLHQLLHTARVLERVRSRCGFPIPINSGFRSPEVNHAVGGKSNSYHLDGRAVDIDIYGMSVGKVDMLETALWHEHPVELYVRSSFIHVAY